MPKKTSDPRKAETSVPVQGAMAPTPSPDSPVTINWFAELIQLLIQLFAAVPQAREHPDGLRKMSELHAKVVFPPPSTEPSAQTTERQAVSPGEPAQAVDETGEPVVQDDQADWPVKSAAPAETRDSGKVFTGGEAPSFGPLRRQAL